jgi:hypothetical protein
MQVPERFKHANPVDIVFEVGNENISNTGFRERDWNRNRNKSLLNKLKTSMKKNGQLIPGMVADDGFVDEGNHRLDACSQEGLPYKFIIRSDELDDTTYVKEVNIISKNWSMEDFRDHYIQLGLDPYKKIKIFCENYKLDLSNVLSVIYNNERDTVYPNRESLTNMFKNGDFHPTQEEWLNARECMMKIEEIGKKWDQHAVKKKLFILAYLRCLALSNSKVNRFDHDRFVQQLDRYVSKMRECVKTEDYLDLIAVIYNMGLQRENKIWLY